jgi:hypothetical protein
MASSGVEKPEAEELKSENSNLEIVLIDIEIVKKEKLPTEYPADFVNWATCNEVNYPTIESKNGIALSLMLKYKNCYWNRETGEAIFNYFKIKSKDVIQCFNKHEQWGLKTNHGKKSSPMYYIKYPLVKTSKPDMRKKIKYNETEDDRNTHIDAIKSNIKKEYIDIPNEEWQVGHKNPDITDNTPNNLVYQPPIQASYRDDYIFLDTLTKMPRPKKLQTMLDDEKFPLSINDLNGYLKVFQLELQKYNKKKNASKRIIRIK